MNFTSKIFINDMQNALRYGMAEALRQFKSLKGDVTGVERTLYSTIRETAIKYLESIGYFYLTQHPNFFVIGETSISGTNKRADGFICDPINGNPLYALEVGIGNSGKFWSDYQKSIDEWSRTGILGTFILLFENSGNDASLYRLDSSVLRTPLNEIFCIYPLILPMNPNFQDAMLSLTCFNYFERHQEIVLNMMTISNRGLLINNGLEEIRKWTTNLIAPIIEKENRFLVNHILKTEQITEQQLKDTFEKNPEIIVLQSDQSPFHNFSDEMRKIFSEYLKNHKPITIIFGNWVTKDDWENDSTMNGLLPIEIIGKNHDDGKWDYWENPLKFGSNIIAKTQNNWLDLQKINNPDYSINGFVKSKLKEKKNLHVDMSVKIGTEVFPFIVSDSQDKIIWISSGVGGWGSNWYGKYTEGYQELWRQILIKQGII